MKKENRDVADALVLILQIGITLLVPMILCFLGGVWLDDKLGVKFIGIIGFILGTVAGFQNVYRLVKRFFK